MGTRYFLEITCPKCGFYDDGAYYAPSCEMTEWECEHCGHVIDLENYVGEPDDDASNADNLSKVARDLLDEMQKLE